MKKQPLLSIIIPTLNEEKLIPRLLNSLIKQTDRRFEVIIIDGHSHDKTVSVAKSYFRKLPSLIIKSVRKPNLPMQRNLGARLANNNWFVFMDADTIANPELCQEIIRLASQQKPDVILSLSNPESPNFSTRLINNLVNLGQQFSFLIKRPFIPGSFSVINRKIFWKIGGFDQSFRFAEDHDLTKRLHKAKAIITNCAIPIYSFSQRRYQKQGMLRLLLLYTFLSILSYFFATVPKRLSSYNMGGHNFS
jgi:glycosyltransferase involved in cell wall biosynthesis